MSNQTETNQLYEVAERIHEMRDICAFTVEQMAEKTEVSVETYRLYESGTVDLPFTFIHKCALAFDIGITVTAPYFHHTPSQERARVRLPPVKTESRFRTLRRNSEKSSPNRTGLDMSMMQSLKINRFTLQLTAVRNLTSLSAVLLR